MTSITLRLAAADERDQLRYLMDQYLAELASFGEVDRSYPWLDAYWQPGESRWPYILQGVFGQLAGFALVNTHSPSGRPADHAIAEFYVLPAERRAGVGREAAVDLLHRHPGTWELSAMRANQAALHFWPAVLAAAGAVDLQISEQSDISIFRFNIG